jgi:glutamate-1-semialdehyde 2,1-aminomutase
MNTMNKSHQLYQQAKQFLPGGVNSPVRAFRSVDGQPVFIERGEGAYLIDVDGQRYIDYICSWGPLILGHAHPYVMEKVLKTLARGCSFGAPTEVEVQLAEKVSALMPSIQMMRFVNSGTEAAMSAIRLARGYTNRNKIIKFAGCYHGHSDSLLVSAGSGALTFGVPSSAGVPSAFTEHTLVANYNRLEEVSNLFEQHGEDIAAIIVEPVAGNMNLVMPLPAFLPGLREICDQYGSLLIFDEVMTGFRVGLGGAQAHFDIVPDLTVLGKIVGGGFPAAAFGGKSEIMQTLAPLGAVYQAGTLSGNPVAMSAGLATLEIISSPGFYEDISDKTSQLVSGLQQCANQAGIPFYSTSIGGMFGLFFTDLKNIETENDVKLCDMNKFKQFFHGMLNQGVYFAPSAYEAGFISAVHTQSDLEKTWDAAEKIFKLI